MSKKILIVDDETGIVDEMKDFLTEEGYEVSTADTVKDGVRLVEEFQPDLMVVDMKLPDDLGIVVLKACREKSPQTKTIVVTGYVDQKIMDEAEQLGRDAFLAKPFDLVKLIDEIEKLLG